MLRVDPASERRNVGGLQNRLADVNAVGAQRDTKCIISIERSNLFKVTRERRTKSVPGLVLAHQRHLLPAMSAAKSFRHLHYSL